MADYIAGRGTTALGIIGTSLGGLATVGNGLLNSGIMNGGGGNNYVSKESFDLSMALASAQRDNAILSADLSSEKKMVEVFNAANDKIMNIRDELNTRIGSLENTVNSNASAQAVINCGFNSNIGILQNQMASIMSMTKTVIPNDSVCPGWGTATVSVTTGTSTT